MSNRRKTWGLAAPLVGMAALVASVGFGIAGVATSASGATPRPSAAASKVKADFKNYNNKLASNTRGWCTGAGEPCDGVVYGTIDVVKQTYSNGGGANYAPSVPGPSGQSKYARLHGGGTGSGGYLTTATGCPVPGNENCTGAYTFFGNTPHPKVFPSAGFSTSIKVYLDPAWAAANPGQVVDWDVALSDNTGAFKQDNAFNLCSSGSGGGGWNVSTSNGAGGCSAGPTELTSAGWYTFNQQFSSLGGVVYVSYTILNASNTPVFSNTENTGNATTGVGGPRYGWFADEDVSGLPVAQVSLKK